MITAGMHIQSECDVGGAGLVGCAVKDLDGNILVLTSREILRYDMKFIGISHSKKELIGSRTVSYYHDESEADSSVRLVGWFTPLVPISPILPWSDRKCDSTMPELNSDVTFLTPHGEWQGYISGLSTFAWFNIDDAPSRTLIRDLIQVSLADPSLNYDMPDGVAGGPVFTSGGSLIGIIVGILDGYAFVAPLDKVLEAEGLTLALSEDLMQFNDRINVKLGNDAVTNDELIILQKIADFINYPGGNKIGWEDVLERWLSLNISRCLGDTGIPENCFLPFNDFFSSRIEEIGLEYTLIEFGLLNLNNLKINGRTWTEIVDKQLQVHGFYQKAVGPDLYASTYQLNSINAWESGNWRSSLEMVLGYIPTSEVT